jgi:hypothetical protein
MNVKPALLALSALLPLSFLAWAVAQPPVQPIDRSEGALMRSKLQRSQAVLEGLLRKDFAAVAAGARQMKLISEAAEWPRPRDAVYEHLSAEFRRQCNELESLAKTENHRGVTFTYLQMTNLCIQCHDYIRDSLRIAHPGSPRSDVQRIPSQWPEGRR